MTAPAHKDRTHESVINDTLARLLRERLGLTTAAETLHGRARPDVLVRLPEGPIVLETEFDPALTVDADALSRLGIQIDGRPVQTAFAVVVPARLRSVDQQHLYERLAAAVLEWREWRIDGTSGLKLGGTLFELGEAVARVTAPAADLDAAVDALDEGVRRAGAWLYGSPGTLARVAKIFNAPPVDETANMAALVVTNAMVFQERLASAQEAVQPTSAARRDGRFARVPLLQAWEAILDIDYYPIFSMARDVVSELSDIEAAAVLDECAGTASRLLGMKAVGRHDLAGQIFNRLIADRKLLAAFYTSIPASTLLAGLALSPDRWPRVDWSDVASLSRLRVADPACGTGTLLMAAYRQIVQNHAAASSVRGEPVEPRTGKLHKALVEQVLFGADVVQAAIHLTAATLAAMSPSVGFARMQLHTLRMGLEPHAPPLAGVAERLDQAGVDSAAAAIRLGSLDWLEAPETQSYFSATEEQIGAKGEALARVLSLPEDDPQAQRAVAARTSALLKGTPANQMAGHAASFTVLADRLVKPDGRVALVLPVTALAGESWRDVRQMLASRYAIEFVVSSHDPKLRSMSYDTGIAEALLVARRLRADESPSGRGLFVNLWRAPYRETEALALVNAVNAAASAPLHRSDGPPVGGSPLFVGGQQWGELLDGPVDAGPWTAARWQRGQTGQFAAALERGELWADDGTHIVARVPIAPMAQVCNVGPQDRRIRGSLGAFDAYHGWDGLAQFPALWAHSQKVHQGLVVDPNARLVPQADRNHGPIWSQAGTLHMTRDVRYNSQRIMTTRTDIRALGVRAWFTLHVREDDPMARSR